MSIFLDSQSLYISSSTVAMMCYQFVMRGQWWWPLDKVCCHLLLVSFAQPGTLSPLHRPVSPHSSASSPPWPSSLLQLRFPVKTHNLKKIYHFLFTWILKRFEVFWGFFSPSVWDMTGHTYWCLCRFVSGEDVCWFVCTGLFWMWNAALLLLFWVRVRVSESFHKDSIQHFSEETDGMFRV